MLEVRLLGRFEVCLHGKSVEIPSRPAQSLFAYLILNPGVNCRREMLAGLLWPDSTESNARSYLRHALWRIKQALGDGHLISDNISISFDKESPYWLDVSVLEKPLVSDVPVEKLIEEVAVYSGDLLPGFYDEWIFSQRERIHSIYEQKIGVLLDDLLRAERWREVIDWAEHWISTSPAPEPAYRALMYAHNHTGNRGSVVSSYERCKNALWTELGIEPSEQTNHTADMLLSEDITISRVETRPAGKEERRSGFASLQSLQLTPFVGRQQEISDVVAQLNDPACRLLTLIGHGGIGKTRLAVEAAGNLSYTPYFVPLAEITSPSLLVSTIAEVLGLSFYGGQEPRKRLIDYLADQSCLLILDNMEHLTDGADLISEILHNTQDIKFLATSRIRLNHHGEWLFEVEGMDLPEDLASSDLEKFSAVELFLRNAQRIKPGFLPADGELSLIARICQMVEGVPLAIELASAWVRVLSTREISEELQKNLDFLTASRKDILSRHQSLRTVFEHTWELLPIEEQVLFKNLTVFRGGFGRDAAHRVANASLHSLSTLADYSLLRWSRTERYFIHHTLHQYGNEILEDAGKEKLEINNRHCRFYRSLAQRYFKELEYQQKVALKAIELEIGNLRAAWNWAIESNDTEALDQMLDCLFIFYQSRGWFQEAESCFKQGADVVRDTQKANENGAINTILGRILTRLGEVQSKIGQYNRAINHLTESLEILRQANAMEEVTFSLHVLGGVYWDRGKYNDALFYHRESEAICREIEYERGLTISLDSQGFIHMSLGNFKEARELLMESLEIFRRLGDRMGSAGPQGKLGWVAFVEGDYEKAQQHFKQAIAISEEYGNRMVLALDMAGLSVTLNTQQKHQQAKELALDSLTIARDTAYQLAIVTALGSLGDAVRAEGDLQQARTYLLEGFSIASRLRLMPMHLLLLIVWGSLLADEGENEKATKILSLILHNAGDVKAFARVAQLRLEELKKKLQPAVYADAKSRGESADLQPTVQAIVEEMHIR